MQKGKVIGKTIWIFFELSVLNYTSNLVLGPPKINQFRPITL